MENLLWNQLPEKFELCLQPRVKTDIHAVSK